MQTQDACTSILRHLGDRAAAVFVREPRIDPLYPRTSDVDVLAFGEVDLLIPERLNLPVIDGGLPIDVIWLPRAMLTSPSDFSAQGLLAHRLLTSSLLFDRDGRAADFLGAVGAAMTQPQSRLARIGGFMEMGYLAVREIGLTRDFPPLSLFWLHTAFAAALAALADTLGQLCPNVYTRPMDCLRTIPAQIIGAWDSRMIDALRLDVAAAPLIESLHEIHAQVSRLFPEPQWPDEMRSTTRAEYRYFLDRNELEWRISVAREMIARGDQAAAVYYLRFWSYCLARVPMVWQCAQERRDVSFVRPERAAGRALRSLCPQILQPLTAILGGEQPPDTAAIERAISATTGFRDHVAALAQANGIPAGGFKPWIPYQSVSKLDSTESIH
jgi:hypothetical protein